MYLQININMLFFFKNSQKKQEFSIQRFGLDCECLLKIIDISCFNGELCEKI